jgi:hypothetical protein
MELESLKTFDVFGMTYDQYVEGKVHEHCFLNEIYFACFGKHLEHIRNESNS